VDGSGLANSDHSVTNSMVTGMDGPALRAWWRNARRAAAITANTPEGSEFAGLGAGSVLAFPQGPFGGVTRIHIGNDCLINEYAVLQAGLPGADLGSGEPIIELGDRCVLGRGTEILAMSSVIVGDDVMTASRVTIVDHHHRHDLPEVPVGWQWPLAVRPVRIGTGSVISTGAAILAGAQIGEYSMVASGAQVRGGVYPPRSVLAGVPAVVVRTHSR
jgi:acetyltransferase-like isoleucine patch superfamily enzyme